MHPSCFPPVQRKRKNSILAKQRENAVASEPFELCRRCGLETSMFWVWLCACLEVSHQAVKDYEAGTVHMQFAPRLNRQTPFFLKGLYHLRKKAFNAGRVSHSDALAILPAHPQNLTQCFLSNACVKAGSQVLVLFFLCRTKLSHLQW